MARKNVSAILITLIDTYEEDKWIIVVLNVIIIIYSVQVLIVQTGSDLGPTWTSFVKGAQTTLPHVEG